MRTENFAGEPRLSAASRYELLVGIANAIGTYRDPQELFGALARKLHRVVRFDYIGATIRDEKSNTFHRHSVHAETEAAIPSDPELAIEESDAWWVYQNQKPLITSLDARDARFSKFQEILKKKYQRRIIRESMILIGSDIRGFREAQSPLDRVFPHARVLCTASPPRNVTRKSNIY
jgi:hypothetical protein